MNIKNMISGICIWLVFAGNLSAQNMLVDPSFEEVLSIQQASQPEISPDGKNIIFTVSSPDWEGNRYDSELWIVKSGKEPFQLTNNPKGSNWAAQWSPDGRWISYLAEKDSKTQLFVIREEGGESFQVTNEKEGIDNYEWSPDGKKIALVKTDKESKSDESKKKRYGEFTVEDKEFRYSRIYGIDFNEAKLNQVKLPCYKSDSLEKDCGHWPGAVLLTDSIDFSIENFKWSPDGKKIAITHQPDPLINTFFKSDISIIDVETKELKLLVNNPGSDGFIDWSPNSKSVLFTSDLTDTTSNYYLNRKLFRIDIDGKNEKRMAADFDENLGDLTWTPAGIYATAFEKTTRSLFLLDPKSGKIETFLANQGQRMSSLSLSRDGKIMAFIRDSGKSLRELYRLNTETRKVEKLTDFTSQISNWKYSESEVISWTSKDGATIEGILHKPMNYDPAKKYPLLVVIHGGPTGISLPTPAPAYVYPMIQWLNKGALILQPNYRGSAGYGEVFRSLNVKNLGVGDAWDVMSGIDYLDKKGLIDREKMGCMGWSQGGYISAFLTTTTTDFKAISVGAGISNWMTYYVNTDIHPFTRQYLKATPWEDEAIYRKTSPITFINQAVTPTLIQHGEFDKRVPIPNAYELFQGLQDMGVETQLIVYKGFGHGISKPRERLAAMWHNWQWFNKYIWQEDVDLPTE